MYAKITYLFDNPATVFFAIFMSLWGKKQQFYKFLFQELKLEIL